VGYKSYLGRSVIEKPKEDNQNKEESHHSDSHEDAKPAYN
jgi:hypothetical protein